VRRWLAALVLLGGAAWIGLMGWAVARGGASSAYAFVPGLALCVVGLLHLLPDRRPLEPHEVRVEPQPLVSPRPRDPPEGKPPVIWTYGGRGWDPTHPLGPYRMLPPRPMREPRESDTIRLDVRPGVPDARVGRAVRAACRAARRRLPHRGGVRAHVEVAPDLDGGPRALQARLEIHAVILHAEDREACVEGFRAELARRLA